MENKNGIATKELAEKLISIINDAATTEADLIVSRKDSPLLDDPQKVFAVIPERIRRAKKEHFLAFYLDTRNRLIGKETVSIGTLSASLVHPREVFSPALMMTAASIIVAHNHPSGDVSPSPEDKTATQRLIQAGRILGIPVLDHLIVSEHFFSFREHGLMTE